HAVTTDGRNHLFTHWLPSTNSQRSILPSVLSASKMDDSPPSLSPTSRLTRLFTAFTSLEPPPPPNCAAISDDHTADLQALAALLSQHLGRVTSTALTAFLAALADNLSDAPSDRDGLSANDDDDGDDEVLARPSDEEIHAGVIEVLDHYRDCATATGTATATAATAPPTQTPGQLTASAIRSALEMPDREWLLLREIAELLPSDGGGRTKAARTMRNQLALSRLAVCAGVCPAEGEREGVVRGAGRTLLCRLLWGPGGGRVAAWGRAGRRLRRGQRLEVGETARLFAGALIAALETVSRKRKRQAAREGGGV
ncbi:hypothetical protein DFH27DRAFT_639804, partial [Peziza echinospora]